MCFVSIFCDDVMPNLLFDRFESTWPLVEFERADVTRHSKNNVNMALVNNVETYILNLLQNPQRTS